MRMGFKIGRFALVAVVASIVVPVVSWSWTLSPVAAAGTGPSCELLLYTSIGAPGATVVGHAFVDLRQRSSTGSVSHEIFGLYPKTNWYLDTAGDVKSDSDTKWSWRLGFTLTPTQCNSAGSLIDSQRQRPNRYRLNYYNCMSWARGILTGGAGITLNEYKDWLGIPSPRVFRDALEKAGDGGTLEGGKVLKNPSPDTSASGAPDPPSSVPPCCDGAALLDEGITHPRALSSRLDEQFSRYRLPKDHLNQDGSYSVVIKDAALATSLYAVSWGDGSSTLGQRPITLNSSTVGFRHTYQAVPTDTVRVIVLENGRVSLFAGSLSGPESGTGHEARVLERPPGPQHSYV